MAQTNISNSTSPLETELPLAQIASPPEIESSPTGEPFCKSKLTTRILDLGPFHEAQDLFSKLNKEIDESVTENHETESYFDAHYEQSHEIAEGKKGLHIRYEVDSPIGSMGEDKPSFLVQSQESFLTESKDSMSSMEHATSRILAVLNSYLHDLENGMLFTELAVDTEVAKVLKDMCDSFELTYDEPYDGRWDIVSLSDMSNEMGVIREVIRYREELQKNGETVAESVYDAAQAILFWDVV